MHVDRVQAVKYQAATPYLAALFVVALLAFWPTYLSLSPSASSAYTHLHVLTAALWMLILVVQPVLIKSRRVALHRAIGKASYVLAPLMFVSILLLANNRIRIAPADAYAIQTYILYLQLSLAALFAGLYALAVWFRRNTAFHARLMVCTALTLVDPIVIRLMFWAQPSPTWNYQWATFGLTDLALLAMIWLDRRYPPGRSLLLWVLAAVVAAQIPALFGLTEGPAWQSFARWFASLPLT
jgi:hypothetical protein